MPLWQTINGKGERDSPYRRVIAMAAERSDLDNVIDFEVIRNAKLRTGVDPLGGAGMRYWPAIAERYRLDLTIVNARWLVHHFTNVTGTAAK